MLSSYLACVSLFCARSLSAHDPAASKVFSQRCQVAHPNQRYLVQMLSGGRSQVAIDRKLEGCYVSFRLQTNLLESSTCYPYVLREAVDCPNHRYLCRYLATGSSCWKQGVLCAVAMTPVCGLDFLVPSRSLLAQHLTSPALNPSTLAYLIVAPTTLLEAGETILGCELVWEVILEEESCRTSFLSHIRLMDGSEGHPLFLSFRHFCALNR